MTTFRRKNVLTFDPTPGVEGVSKDRIINCLHSVAFMNPRFDMQYDLF